MTGRCCRLCPCFLCCPFPAPPFAPPPHCSLRYIICCSQQVYSSPNVSQLSQNSRFSLFSCFFGCEANHSKCWNTECRDDWNIWTGMKRKWEWKKRFMLLCIAEHITIYYYYTDSHEFGKINKQKQNGDHCEVFLCRVWYCALFSCHSICGCSLVMPLFFYIIYIYNMLGVDTIVRQLVL